MPNDDFLSNEDREAAMRAEFYATHKAHGSLGTFYYFYYENAPLEYQYPPPPQRGDGGRER